MSNIDFGFFQPLPWTHKNPTLGSIGSLSFQPRICLFLVSLNFFISLVSWATGQGKHRQNTQARYLDISSDAVLQGVYLGLFWRFGDSKDNLYIFISYLFDNSKEIHTNELAKYRIPALFLLYMTVLGSSCI